MRLLLLLLAVPLIEIALFIQLGGAIGLFATLVIVVLTALLGAVLLRTQGLHVIQNLKLIISSGGDPTEQIVHGVLVFSAGLLLLTPGFFTDAVGLVLLSSSARAYLIRHGAQTLATKFAPRGWQVSEGVGPIIDVEEPRS